jgi:predicted restriction endonuclease
MKFELEIHHRNSSDKELIDNLKKVANFLKKDSVTIDEYNENGEYHATTLTRRFGSWFVALEKAGLQKTRTLGVTDEQYFQNLEEVWTKLGRQPKYNDMQKPLSKYVAGAYEHRFGTWRKALEKFVEYINQEDVPKIDKEELKSKPIKTHKTKRSISWRLRFIVMRQDGFKCKICGRSPATDPKIVLHVDHIVPWSKGGETVPENLQTLCSKCNIGKSNLHN